MSKRTQSQTSDNLVQSTQASEQKIQKETIHEYLKVYGFNKTLTEAEQNQFFQIALAGNLDPFKRELYVAVYGEGENRKVSFLTGYQVYLKRAERTGKLDGWRARFEGDGSKMKAIVEIFRKDWSHSFTHEVYWEEAVQKKKDGSPTQFWAKQPRFQLRKVAMAQAFRLAFPDELGGLPYESAELPDNDTTHDVQTPANPVNTIASQPTARIPNDAKTSNSNTSLVCEALDDSGSFDENAPTDNQNKLTPETLKQEVSKSEVSSKSSTLKEQSNEVIKEISAIMTAAKDGISYFTDDEKEEARQIIKSTKLNEKGVSDMNDFKTYLIDELSKREVKKAA
jgi:phage recombination protein Bet